MNGRTVIPTQGVGRRPARMTVAVALLSWFAGATAVSQVEAARIRARGVSARSSASSSSARVSTAWQRFLAAGPTTWATTQSPAFPSNPRLPIVNGALIGTPFVDYLFWRRNLDPSRFDRNHPNVAQVFNQLVPADTAVAAAEVVVGTVPTPGPTTPSVDPVAQELVPEPGTLALGVTMIGAFAWWKRRSA